MSKYWYFNILLSYVNHLLMIKGQGQLRRSRSYVLSQHVRQRSVPFWIQKVFLFNDVVSHQGDISIEGTHNVWLI